ncbi:MAG: hypothetical protein HY226_05950, partial [Candidatus Vogelbacteria bacterium]|nr:hypothetical protein [Candidatus Vogelbacteria bacterium]
MPHKNFYKFKARDNYELGLLMGAQFKKETETALKIAKENLEDFKLKTSRANKFLEFNQRYFPEYIEELNGYAKGANVDFFDIFALSLEDEVDQDYPHSANKQTSEKCTTLITNNGKLFAHNEDWDKGSEEKISIVEKIVGNLSVFELFYTNTLGGNSV